MKVAAGDQWRRQCQRLCEFSAGHRPNALLLKPEYSSVSCLESGIIYLTTLRKIPTDLTGTKYLGKLLEDFRGARGSR